MTAERGVRALLIAALFAVLGTGWAVGLVVGAPAAGAVQPCTITGGSLEGNNPARVGEPVVATAQVSGTGCNRSGGWILFEENGNPVDQKGISGPGSYSTVLQAPAGLTVVSAVLWTGDSRALGTIDAAGNPPPSTPRTTTVVPPPPPQSSTQPSAVAASTTASSAKTSTTASKTSTLVPVVLIPSFGGADSSDSPTSTPSASTSTSTTGTAIAFKVDTIHGNGSVNPIPAGLLIAVIVFVGALAGTCVHLVRANYRSPEHLG